MSGGTGNRTGGCVTVREPTTGLQGLFYIDGDTHTWKNGQYFNKLTLNFKSVMDEQDAGPIAGRQSVKNGSTMAAC